MALETTSNPNIYYFSGTHEEYIELKEYIKDLDGVVIENLREAPIGLRKFFANIDSILQNKIDRNPEVSCDINIVHATKLDEASIVFQFT